ncbi:hypothetical protein [Haloplanus natans]|uniref:hypothetical protein n=1 Tax=Haloplanus natans TaxID=376171 RepID=UPI0006782D47|nr:hypothetical protein [Haloplanus natans]
MTGPTRRDLLRGALGAVALAPASAAGGPPATDAVETGIPEPFDAMPTLEEPPERLRQLARTNFPPEAVPDDGAIVDPTHQRTVEYEITVPEWVLEATRWRLSHTDTEELDRWRVREFLSEYALVCEQYRTSDGRDAVDVLFDEVAPDG